MKKATISIQIEQEKLRALRFYAGKKESSLESELEEFIEKLYEKYVPAQAREYIGSLTPEEIRPCPRPDRAARERPNREVKASEGPEDISMADQPAFGEGPTL